MNPKYPVFIPTKGRWESRWTIQSFENIGIPFKIVVEPQEFDNYAAVVDPKKIIVTPHSNKGLVTTRNWIWDLARDMGTEFYWTFDDNIGENLRQQGVMGLYRLNNNLKTPVSSGVTLRAIEDFVERYENVPISGMNYFMFASRKTVVPPYYLNTRIYSNMLIRTDAKDPSGKPYRNEGFYNDDTDICIRVLKDGFCTILFNAFLIYKRTTMSVSGGMTPHYINDGRLKMANELRDKHPDITTVTTKWGRPQHQVDYSSFRQNKLKLKPGVVIPDGVNNYGMVLRTIDEKQKPKPIAKTVTKQTEPVSVESKPKGVFDDKWVDYWKQRDFHRDPRADIQK